MSVLKHFYHILCAFKNFKDIDTNTSLVYLRKSSLSQSISNDMCDDALMCFQLLLVYVLISNNHCNFLAKSKNSKSNDIIHILSVKKRKEKVAFVSINK